MDLMTFLRLRALLENDEKALERRRNRYESNLQSLRATLEEKFNRASEAFNTELFEEVLGEIRERNQEVVQRMRETFSISSVNINEFLRRLKDE